MQDQSCAHGEVTLTGNAITHYWRSEGKKVLAAIRAAECRSSLRPSCKKQDDFEEIDIKRITTKSMRLYPKTDDAINTVI